VDLSVARLLVRYRKSVGLTQEMLAGRAGISTRAISDMERGLVRHPRRRTWHALAGALALSEPERSEFLSAVDREPVESVEPIDVSWRPLELPPEAADLVGREDELVELLALLDDGPRPGYRAAAVVSVFGAPGVGKTTFAVHAVHRLADRFPDGCLFVNLGRMGQQPVTSEQALGGVLLALGVAEQQLPADAEARSSLYRAMLRGRRMALLLDNAVDEAQVRPLLPSSPDCLVLVTSRRVLSGLESVTRMLLDELRPVDSSGLLASIIGRARADAEPEAVRRVAELCGNLPLALRIAGNRLATRPSWRVDALVRQLDDERRLLNALTAGDLEVRSAFEVSYRQCDAESRSVFRRLSLVAGHEVAVDVAAALCAVEPDSVEHQLEELVDASMLEAAADGRYALHDLMRVFAGERLALEESEEEIGEVRDRLAAWVLDAGTHAGLLLVPPDYRIGDAPPPYPAVVTRADAIKWLDTEQPLWLDALRYEARAGRHERTLAFCHAVYGYSSIRVDAALWCEVFGRGVAAARALGRKEEEAAQLNFFGVTVGSVRGGYEDALRAHESAWQAAREAGSRTVAAWALHHCGRMELMWGRHVEAADRIRAALTEFGELGDGFGGNVSLSLLGMALHQLGRFDEAISVHRRVVDYYRSSEMSQYRNHLAVSLLRLADSLEAAVEIAAAEAAYREAGRLAAAEDYAIVEGLAAFGCGRCQDVLGDRAAARDRLGRALDVFTQIGESWQRARAASRLAALGPERTATRVRKCCQ
jgi:tetratricopeptide (TPR) repeat protein/transcriptional regulator with XRE-family HTH domain